MITSVPDALAELQTLIDREIPPAKHMGFSIESYADHRLRLSAPLSANLNHHGSAFGGSQFSLAAICGWALTVLTLRRQGLAATIVVQSVQCDYVRPLVQDLKAEAYFDLDDLPKLRQQLEAGGSGRLVATADVGDGKRLCARFRAYYSIKNPVQANLETALR